MTADKMATQSLAQADSWFKIDRGADSEAAEPRDIKRLHRHIRVESVRVQGHRCQADTVDRDALALFVVRPWQPLGAYRQAHITAALVHCADRAFRLNNSCEHQCSIFAVIFVSAPTRRTSVISSVLRSASAVQFGVSNMRRVLEPIMWGDW